MQNGKRRFKRAPSSAPTNKKVKNATEVIYDGIKFRSKLEVYTYKKLKEYKIKAEYETLKLELIQPFEYKGVKVRKMTYTPDFVSDNFIIECKGRPNDVWPIKYKLFLNYLYRNNLDYDVYIPHNHKEVDEVIEQIREKNDRIQKSKESISTKRSFKLFPFLV